MRTTIRIALASILLIATSLWAANTETVPSCPLSVAVSAPAVTPVAQAPTPTVTATSTDSVPGTTWSYVVVGLTASGYTQASAVGTTTVGSASFTVPKAATDYNTITWEALAGETAGFDIYRVAVGTSPTTTGKIGHVAHNATKTLIDNGLVADGTTAPVTNTTGTFQLIAAPAATSGPPVYIGASSVPNPSLGQIYVCTVDIKVNQTTTAANFQLVQGTGTNCNTGATWLTNLIYGTASVKDSWQFQGLPQSAIRALSGNAVCGSLSYAPTGATFLLTYAIR